MTQCWLALFGSQISFFFAAISHFEVGCFRTFSECVKKSFSCCCCTFWNSLAGCFCCFWPALSHSQSLGPVTSPDSRHHQWSTIKTPPCCWHCPFIQNKQPLKCSHQTYFEFSSNKAVIQNGSTNCADRMYTTTQRLRKVRLQNVCCSFLGLFNLTCRVTYFVVSPVYWLTGSDNLFQYFIMIELKM